MKVLLTGGHFSPAYSVIEELQKINAEVVIVGRRHPFEGDKTSDSFEFKVSKELNLPFIELKTGRLQRKFTRHTITSLIRTPLGLFNAIKILNSSKPDVVLTFGGYLALPIAYAAWMLGIPVVTHEQTQRMGLSNKIISKVASVVCVSFESSKDIISHNRVVVTGNPVRDSIYSVQDKIMHPKGYPILYITGGSTGSHVINRTVNSAISELVKKYIVIHQTGENEFNDFQASEQIKARLNSDIRDRYIPRKFIFPTEIGYVYKNATLVIGRSGANTALELIACNKPSILIPLSHGQTGEQLQNARLIESLGLGKIVEQKDLTADLLVQTIDDMVSDIEKYKVTQGIIDKYIFVDSAKRIVAELTAQYEKKKNKKK